MSYSNTFQDYLRDIPMEIGRKFYPPPIVNLPTLVIPEPVKNVLYHFNVEKKARQQYDELNTKPGAENDQGNLVNGVTPADSLASSAASSANEVLQPCAPPPRGVAPACPLPSAVKSVSFEEFEGRGTVFDEIEWKAIDDKLALSQPSLKVLGNVHLKSTSESAIVQKSLVVDDGDVRKPPVETLTNDNKPLTVSAIPPYPVLEFGVPSGSDEQLVTLNSSGKLGAALFSKPANSAPIKGAVPSTSQYELPLRIRLLTKGYRENLVNVALEKLPRERLPHVEYYIKGMSILEKRDVDVAKTIIFLLDSNLTEKQAVVQRAQTAEQLLGMGFSVEQVFPALLACHGDRVKALDTLLGSR